MPELPREFAKGLIQELAREEEAFMQADAAFDQALARYKLATGRYVAVRDEVTEALGYSPYSKEAFVKYGVALPTEGRYRFMRMATGAAVVAALQEAGEPMTLEQIAEVIGSAAGVSDQRAINAALMKTAGVEKMDDGRYRCTDEDSE